MFNTYDKTTACLTQCVHMCWLLQGGYLERHKRRHPDSLGMHTPHPTQPPPAGPTQDWGSPAAATSSHATQLPQPEALLSLGNFTDAIHTNLDLLTLSNVYPGSNRMWLHVASVYVITLVALKVGRLSDWTTAGDAGVQQELQALPMWPTALGRVGMCMQLALQPFGTLGVVTSTQCVD